MNVSELMSNIRNGTIVLPDFQRSFIWEPEDVRELLVSVVGEYFIGTMLLLENLEKESPFALRLIEGVEKVNKGATIQSIVKILLDGQQRATALFYALHEPDLPLKGRKNPYRFYLDFDKASKKEWNDAVLAASTNDKRKLTEIKNNVNLIPFSHLADIGGMARKFKDHPSFNEIIALANSFMNREIHTVSLPRETDLERIVETFERINRTGEPLSIFELLTARLYKDKIKLRDLLESAKTNYRFVESTSPESILKVIALLRDKEPKRRNILKLEPANFVQDWERACKALESAYVRATDVKQGYGVLDFKKWMPYTTMLIPLAAMIDHVKTGGLDAKGNYDKIDRWYWTSVFSNAYDQAADTASATHFASVKSWIADDSKIPDFIQKFDPQDVDYDVDKQSSAVYRGVIGLIVLKGALDFKTGQPPQFEREKVQDDHIFPKSIYKEHRVANRTLISTNAEKIDKKPSEYFAERLTEHGKGKLQKILESHIIPPQALNRLLNDNMPKFIEIRKQAIVDELKKRL